MTDEPNLDANDPPVGNGSGSPGLQAVENAVGFTNETVLDPPDETDLSMGMKTMIDQSLAMMVQDARSFLQSIEMLLVPTAAQLIAKYLLGSAEMAKVDGMHKPVQPTDPAHGEIPDFVAQMTPEQRAAMLAALSDFHASITGSVTSIIETAVKHQSQRK